MIGIPTKEAIKKDLEIFNNTTDIKYTKKVTFGTPFTSIDAYYLISEATKKFGLFGKGWGIRDSKWSETQLPDGTILAIIDVIFFFPNGSFPIRNSDKLYYKTKTKGMKLDEEVYKKIETNTISKALSRIGFGTDIYMGKFDDDRYRNDAAMQHVKCNDGSVNAIRKELKKYNKNEKDILSHFKITSLTDLLYSNFEEAMNLIIPEEKAFSDENIKKDGNIPPENIPNEENVNAEKKSLTDYITNTFRSSTPITKNKLLDVFNVHTEWKEYDIASLEKVKMQIDKIIQEEFN
jgi:hypothetical protein